MSNRLQNHLSASVAPDFSSRARYARAVIVTLIAAVAGCATQGEPWTRYQHTEPGYSVPYPQALPKSAKLAWRQLRVDEADLAFHESGGAFMAISSHCGERTGDPAVLARQLLVGLQNRTPVSSESFEFAGGQAFAQIVDSVDSNQGDSAIRTKTVTLVRGGCVVDWVITALGSLDDVEASFDVWWRGFDPGSMPASTDGVRDLEP